MSTGASVLPPRIWKANRFLRLFTFDDLVEYAKHIDDALCEEFGFIKTDWSNYHNERKNE